MPNILHLIDNSEPGSWADCIAHSPNLKTGEYSGHEPANRLASPVSIDPFFHDPEVNRA